MQTPGVRQLEARWLPAVVLAIAVAAGALIPLGPIQVAGTLAGLSFVITGVLLAARPSMSAPAVSDDRVFETSSAEGPTFYRSFLVSLTLVSLPFKNLGYLVGPVYLLLQWVGGNPRVVRRFALLTGGLLAISALSLLVESLRGNDVNLPGMFLGSLTYMPLTILLSESLAKHIDDRVYARIIAASAWFVIVQSVLGILQFAFSSNSDAVCGTSCMLEFTNGGITIKQVYYTFTLYGLILFLCAGPKTPLTITAILSGVITTTLAQAGHQTMFLIASIALVGVTGLRRPSQMIGPVVVAGLTIVLVSKLYPHTVEIAEEWYHRSIVLQDSPKALATEGALRALADPKTLLLGSGMGQFTSRAALMTSNDYLRVQLPRVLTGKSSLYVGTIEPAIGVFREVGEGSAIAKPYSSALSVIVEFGLPLAALLVSASIAVFVRNLKHMRSHTQDAARYALFCNVGMLFFLLCCLVENYAEFPEAVFVPILLYIALQSRIRLAKRTARQSRTLGPVPV